GKVYQAGTLSGNPIAMSAGIAVLTQLNDQKETFYSELEATTQKITSGIQAILDQKNLPYTINQIGSMYSLFFTDRKVVNFEDAQSCNMEGFATYFQSMLDKGIYLAPSQYETLFVSSAIGNKEIEAILIATEASL
ncbi:MAG: aminotransferase class III-fold pyridoxal phosphate-dependent enzyme, partial [Cyclobacteriaceae bacterium]